MTDLLARDAPAGAPTRGQRVRSLAALLASAFAVGLTVGMATPLVALAMERQGYDSLVIGLNAAAGSAAVLGIGPFVRPILRRIGAVPALILGLAVAAAALATLASAAALPAWFLLRITMALGIAVNWIVSESWINSLATPDSRGRIVGLYATLWGGGVAGGPVILTAAGTAGAAPFLVGGALLGVAALPLLAVRRLAPEMGRRAAPLGPAATVRSAPLVMAAGLVCGFGEGALFALFPLYGLAGGFDAEAAVLLTTALAVGGVALQPVLGRLADRMARRTLLLAIAAIGLGCAALVPAVLRIDLLLWPLLFVWGGVVAGFYTLGLVLLGDRFAGGDIAGANATYIMAYTVGMMAGPVAGGAAMRAWGPHGLMAALTALFALFLLAGLRRRPEAG